MIVLVTRPAPYLCVCPISSDTDQTIKGVQIVFHHILFGLVRPFGEYDLVLHIQLLQHGSNFSGVDGLCALFSHQVWSLTLSYSVGFLQSRIPVKKVCF